MLNKKLVKSTVALLAMPALFGLVNANAGDAGQCGSACFSGDVSVGYALEGSENSLTEDKLYTVANFQTRFSGEDYYATLFTGFGPSNYDATALTSSMTTGEAFEAAIEYGTYGLTVFVSATDGTMIPQANGGFALQPFAGQTQTNGLTAANLQNPLSPASANNAGATVEFCHASGVCIAMMSDTSDQAAAGDMWTTVTYGVDFGGYELFGGFGSGDAVVLHTGEGITGTDPEAPTTDGSMFIGASTEFAGHQISGTYVTYDTSSVHADVTTAASALIGTEDTASIANLNVSGEAAGFSYNMLISRATGCLMTHQADYGTTADSATATTVNGCPDYTAEAYAVTAGYALSGNTSLFLSSTTTKYDAQPTTTSTVESGTATTAPASTSGIKSSNQVFGINVKV